MATRDRRRGDSEPRDNDGRADALAAVYAPAGPRAHRRRRHEAESRSYIRRPHRVDLASGGRERRRGLAVGGFGLAVADRGMQPRSRADRVTPSGAEKPRSRRRSRPRAPPQPDNTGHVGGSGRWSSDRCGAATQQCSAMRAPCPHAAEGETPDDCRVLAVPKQPRLSAPLLVSPAFGEKRARADWSGRSLLALKRAPSAYSFLQALESKRCLPRARAGARPGGSKG
jgi:hypothetical protein